MNQENHLAKHNTPARRRRLRRRKQEVLAFGLVALLCSAISFATLAFVFTGTGEVKNTFKSSYVACDVIENGTDGTSDFDGEVKTNVRVKNTGEVQSYIRAAVVVTWMSENGKTVTAQKPVDGVDYDIVYANEKAVNETDTTVTNWELGIDGYWYYKIPVNVGGSTQNLIKSCTLKSGVTPPEGFYLSVEIVASAIQSTPSDVVVTQWSSGVNRVDNTDNGTTLVLKGVQ